MGAFLSALGSSLGMSGPGGIAGGFGQMLGQSIMGQPGQPAQAQAPQQAPTQAGFTNPFNPTKPAPDNQFMTDSWQKLLDPRTGRSPGPWADQYIMNQR